MAILKSHWWHIAVAVLGFSTVFSLLGVYNTHSLPFYMRFTFWMTTMAVGIITSVLVTPYIVNNAFKGKHPIFHVLVGSLIASIPVTFVLTFFSSQFGLHSSLTLWAINYVYVLVISIVVGGIGYPLLLYVGAIGDTSAPNAPSTPPLLERLPPKYHKADLYAVSAEDHYLRVYTSVGEDLILLRFKDALKELSDVDGLQVHRSWWVMKDSFLEASSQDGRKILILKSDIRVPVSRTYLKTTKAELGF